ncbi:MAG: Fic family protein [Patescibacteria group bacterium]
MLKLTQREQEILLIFIKNNKLQSSEVRSEMLKTGNSVALVTVKRTLSKMAKNGFLSVSGAGRSVSYAVSALGRLATQVDAKEYCSVEPDKRYGLSGYNFELFPFFPKEIFSDTELGVLTTATKEYKQKLKHSTVYIRKKELERLIIELSWKSSKIEGNTYTLLDTEKLILGNKKAAGHDEKETRMILNHKDAFKFIYEHPSFFKELTRKNLEELHKILIKRLGVNPGFRKAGVGVVGSKYRPPDNIYQIEEAIESLIKAVSRMKTAYAKALVALLGVSYIQPFEDGNKRTSRLIANAVLFAHNLAPLSYRSVDENDYREATLVFYEINSLAPFKKIFIEQYNFAARHYLVG